MMQTKECNPKVDCEKFSGVADICMKSQCSKYRCHLGKYKHFL